MTATANARTSRRRVRGGLTGKGHDRGSATVLMLGAVCALLTLTLSGVALSDAVIASHRARAAVDLAALAGAEVLLRGGGQGAACAAATMTATANGARTTRCSLVGPSVLVGVSVPVGVRGIGPVTASARAGPSPTGPSSTGSSPTGSLP